jgi:predicted nucleic acid-binding protein
MIYLLDVSTLVALLIVDHEHYGKALEWAKRKQLAVCPLTELGFLRVAVNAYNATPQMAHKILGNFYKSDHPRFIPADLSALEGELFHSGRKSTDWYLANLAAHHNMKLATLDADIKHPAAELVI